MDVADELAIRNLIARVARLSDKWIVEEDLTVNYTEDCVWELAGFPPYCGREAVKRRMNEMLDAGVCGPGMTLRHIVGSLEVVGHPDDPDTATAYSFLIMPNMTNGMPFLLSYGEYVDTLRRVDGTWKIAIRKTSGYSPEAAQD